MNNLYRAWINQPSTAQLLHEYHGQNVLVYESGYLHSDVVRVYFTEGTIISMNVPRIVLSKGWK